MKKIAIFGATGRTGKHLVNLVADGSMTPVCLVRKESKEKLLHETAVLVEGSPLIYDDVKRALTDCDAVLVALNVARKSDWPWAKLVSPPDLLEVSMTNIVKAMGETGAKRIITVSAWGVGDSYAEINGIFRFLINKTNVGSAYAGHEQQEKVLKESNLDWTAVRPVGLTNSTKHCPTRVSQNGSTKLKMSISRMDVAIFMLDILYDVKYYKTTPSISND